MGRPSPLPACVPVMPAVTKRRQSPHPLAGEGGGSGAAPRLGTIRAAVGGSTGSACAPHPGALQGAPPRAQGPARPQRDGDRGELWAPRGTRATRAVGRPLGTPLTPPTPVSSPTPAPEPPLRPGLGGSLQGRAGPGEGDTRPRARQFRGAAGPSSTTRGSPGAGPARGVPRAPPPEPRAAPGAPASPTPAGGEGVARRGVARAERARAGPLGAVRAGGGVDGAPTCPRGAGQWAPGVRQDRHIRACSGPRAPPPHARAPLRLNTGGGGGARPQSLQPPAPRSSPLRSLQLSPPHRPPR